MTTPVEAFEALDAGIAGAWDSVSTRNAIRDAVRSVVRGRLASGLLTHDEATPMLNAVAPEKVARDEERQSRGHVASSRVAEVFAETSRSTELTARRDTALIALLVGASLRR